MMDHGPYADWWRDNTDANGELLPGLPDPVAALAGHVMALQERIDRMPDPDEHGRTHGTECRCFGSQCACAYDHPAARCAWHEAVLQ